MIYIPIQFIHIQYSRLTLVVTFWEASHISLKKTFSSFLSLYIVSYTPRGFPICKKKFHRFSFKNLWTSKWKIYFLHQKVVTHFVEFIGFMVCKTTGSISQSFLLKKIRRKCFVARDIGKTKREKSSKKCKYLWLQSIFFRFFSARMIVRSSRSFCIP